MHNRASGSTPRSPFSARVGYSTRWHYLRRYLALLIVVELALVCTIASAAAATSVAFLIAEPEDGYVAARVYAGRTVPERAAELGFKQPGELDSVLVDLGDTVTAGELLATLDMATVAAQLQQAQADVVLAAANLSAMDAETELARQTETRYHNLRKTGHASEQVYDEQRLALQAKLAQRNVARASLARAEAVRTAAEIAVSEAHIYAPFNGRVQARYVDEGAQVGAGAQVIRLVETGKVEAHIGVPEAMLTRLEPQSVHQVRWDGLTHPATLKTILPEVDASTRTLTAIFSLENSEIPLGAVVELELASRIISAGYWLPLTALTESDRGLWGVFVINADSTVERRLVEVIHVEADQAYVRGTLNPGERVVRTGVQRIVPGQLVEPARQG